MDLAPVYRALVRRHFSQVRIVADRFHVIRMLNHHFLAWSKQIDPRGAQHRGSVSLMQRHRHNLNPEQPMRLCAYLSQRDRSWTDLPFHTAPGLPAAGERPQ